MSVTFHASSAPIRTLDPRTCDCSTYEWNETHAPLADCQFCNGRGVWSCLVCEGKPGRVEDCDRCGGSGVETERVSEGEMNLANGNARILLDALGLDTDELWGELAVDELSAIRRTLMRLRAMPERLSGLEREGSDGYQGAPRIEHDGNVVSVNRGPRIISGGCDRERIEGYLQRFDVLCEIAQEHNSAIRWD